MRRKNSKRSKSKSQEFIDHIKRKLIETVGSSINRLMPKSIHSVTSRCFELKILFFDRLYIFKYEVHTFTYNIITAMFKKTHYEILEMIDEKIGNLEGDNALSFKDNIDIEHIQAFNDINEQERENIWDEWGDEINSLGNLMVLESSINRSISNKVYENKKTGYKGSKYGVVKNLIENNAVWNKKLTIKRKNEEIEKIMGYTFSKD